MEATGVEPVSEDLSAKLSTIIVGSGYFPVAAKADKTAPAGSPLVFYRARARAIEVFRLVDARFPSGGVSGLTTALC